MAFAGDFYDGGVVDESVDGGDGHGFVLEEGFPLAEGLIAGDDNGSSFVAFRDEFKKDVGFVVVFAGVADVVEDEAVEAVEFGEGCGEGEVAFGGLELLEKFGDAVAADTVAGGDEFSSDAGSKVGFADAVGSENEEDVAVGDPVAAAGEFADAGFGDAWHEVEIKVVETFAVGEVGFLQVAGDASGVALLKFVFTKCC